MKTRAVCVELIFRSLLTCYFASSIILFFYSGVREFAWPLEVTQFLLDEGKIDEDHVVIQALAVTVGTLAGAWDSHHVPWRDYQSFAGWCSAVRNASNPRAYRMIQGRRKGLGVGAGQINMVCPSDKKLELAHRAVDYSGTQACVEQRLPDRHGTYDRSARSLLHSLMCWLV